MKNYAAFMTTATAVMATSIILWAFTGTELAAIFVADFVAGITAFISFNAVVEHLEEKAAAEEKARKKNRNFVTFDLKTGVSVSSKAS